MPYRVFVAVSPVIIRFDVPGNLTCFVTSGKQRRSRAGRYKACSRFIITVVCTKRTFGRESRSRFCEFQVWNYRICLYIKVGICFTL